MKVDENKAGSSLDSDAIKLNFVYFLTEYGHLFRNTLSSSHDGSFRSMLVGLGLSCSRLTVF